MLGLWHLPVHHMDRQDWKSLGESLVCRAPATALHMLKNDPPSCLLHLWGPQSYLLSPREEDTSSLSLPLGCPFLLTPH